MEPVEMKKEQIEEIMELMKQNPHGCLLPDHLRYEGMLKPQECRYCECGYIIPEPTEEELKIKAQQTKIEEQSQAINTLTDSVKTLTEHLSKLTLAFNEMTKK
jgi:hypothetical protein